MLAISFAVSEHFIQEIGTLICSGFLHAELARAVKIAARHCISCLNFLFHCERQLKSLLLVFLFTSSLNVGSPRFSEPFSFVVHLW